jgi:hypothetical protein
MTTQQSTTNAIATYLQNQKVPKYLHKYEPQYEYTQMVFAADGGWESCEINHKKRCSDCGFCRK